MQTTINQRVKQLVDSLENGNQSTLAAKAGVTRAVINNIIGGRMNEPSFKVLQKITEAYADVNIQWLLTGEGPMLREGATRSGGGITSTNNQHSPVYSQQGTNHQINSNESALQAEIESLKREVERQEKYIKRLERLLDKQEE